MEIVYNAQKGLLYDLTEGMIIGYNSMYESAYENYGIEADEIVINAYKELWDNVDKQSLSLPLYLTSSSWSKGVCLLGELYDKKQLWELDSVESYISYIKGLSKESLQMLLKKAINSKLGIAVDNANSLMADLMTVECISPAVKWEMLDFLNNPEKHHKSFINFIESYASKLTQIYKANSRWYTANTKAIERKLQEYISDMLEHAAETLGLKKSYNKAYISMSLLNEPAFDIDVDGDDVYIVLGIKSFLVCDEILGRSTGEKLISRLKVVGDQTRFNMLKLIKEKPIYGAELAASLNLSLPTIKHHLEILCASGLIRINKDDGYKIYYSIDEKTAKKFISQLDDFLLKHNK